MAENDFQIGLIGKLDGTQSKQQINSDIDALKKQLNNIDIQAKLGKDAVANLTKQLNTTQISLQNVSIDKNAINNMISQINTALGNININIGANAFNSNGINQAAQNLGRQAGNLISREVENSLKDVTSKEIGLSFRVDKTDSDEFNSAVDREIRKLQQAKNKMVSVNYTTNTKQSVDELTGEYEHVEKLTGAVFKYNTETGEAITKTMKWAQIGTTIDDKGNEVPLMGWVQGLTRYSKALDESIVKVDNFTDKQSRAVTKTKNALASIQREYNDKNSAKPIKDSNNIINLDNQVREVKTAITNLGNASTTTFTDMQNEVDTQISRLKDMVREYRNAETVATSLRSKDIDTVKAQYSSKLDVLTNKMQSSGVYTDSFKKGAENLKNILSSATDASGLTQFLNGLDKLDSGFKRAKSASDEFNKSQKVGINVSGLESKIDNLEKISPQISNFKTQIANADVSVKSLRDDLANVQTQGDFSVVKAKLNAFTDAAKAAGYQVKELANTSKNISIPTITSAISDNGDITTKIKVMSDNFMKLGLSADEVKAKMSTVNTELTELRKLLNANGTESDISSQYEQLNTALKATQNNLTITRSETSVLKSEEQGLVNTSTRLAKANSLKTWADNNTKAMSKYGAEIEQIIGTLTSLETNLTKLDMQRIDTQINTIKSSARDTGNLGLTVFDKLNKAVEKFSGWSVATGTVMKTVSEVRNSVNELKDVDNILTEISKTSDRTKSELKTLGNKSFGHASKFGLKASNWLTGVQEMNRSGFYGEQGNALADTSTLAQSAGDMTAEVANNWILATNAAYKYDAQAEKLNTVLDGANQITNRNSVNMTDLANAMTTVGSNAANAGVKVNELSALIGTAVATTKKEGNEVGTAYKSIFVNLQNTSSSKIVNTLQKAGTSMTEMKNGIEQLRSPIAILKDLAKTYNELDEKDPLRSEITRNIGGKHYANILGSTLDGWSQYEKMLQDYSEGSGSAMKEAEKSANNWTGSLNQLSNSFTKLVSNFANSDAIIDTIQLLNKMVGVVDKVTSGYNLLGTAIGTAFMVINQKKSGGLIWLIRCISY